MAPDSKGKENKGINEEQKFEAGEKVLAYHGPMIYQAKVEEAEVRDGTWFYFLHYLGWSKKWDEWVDCNRLLKDNPENLAKKKKLMEESSAEKKRNRASTSGSAQKVKEIKLEKDDQRPASSEKKRRKTDSVTETSETSEQNRDTAAENALAAGASNQEIKSDQDQFVKIPIPPLLKKHLVEDWRSITEEGRLVKLPRSPTVVEVLQKYLESKTEDENAADDNAAEVSSGLRAYFDRALPAILLYKQERQQYSENFPDGSTKTPAEVYGSEHLLRLFIKLPELLSYIQMDDDTLKLLLEKLTELLKYLQKNQETFFLQRYDGPRVDQESKAIVEKAEAQTETR